MESKLIAAASLAFAFAASTTPTALADLAVRDSSQFTYKYEMVALPTSEDVDGGGAVDFTGSGTWLTLGTGADLGTIKIDASTNGKYLISNQAVGTAGDGWRSLAASSTTGFSVEARVKVTECTGANGAIVIEAGPSDSKVYARLSLFTDKIVWNGTTLMNLDASAWHTYRIARAGGTAVHSVWVDGVLVAENLGTGFTYNDSTLYRMLLGSPGKGWTGKAEVAWLRFDKGAYAPPDPNDNSNRKASTDFAVQYEMADDDARISVTTTTSDWKFGGSSATIAKSGGILSVTTGGKVAYWDTTDATWKNIVAAGTPFTVEFRVKITDCTQSGADRAFNFMTGTPGPIGNLFLGKSSVQWCLSTAGNGTFLTLDASDNSDAMHAFRIAYSGGGRHAFTVWRDGVIIGENLVDCTNFYNYNGNALGIVRFGKAGGMNDGAWDLDYIRWDTTGAYDWKDPPAAFVMVIR